MNKRETAAYSWEMYPDGLLAIGGSGPVEDFYKGDAPWAESREDITSVDIGEGITTVGARAFACFPNLRSVILPKSLRRISFSAFEGCTSLTEVDIPPVLNIRCLYDPEPRPAFSRVLTIGARAFLGTPWALKTWGEAIMSGSTLVEYLGTSRTVEIPDGVTRIAPFAFSERPLSAVIFPETLKEIGEYAFEKTPLLTAVLPASLERVDRGAFARTPFLYSCLVKNPDTVFDPETFTGSALFKPGDSLGKHISREGTCRSTIYSVNASPLREAPDVQRLSFKKSRSFGTIWRAGDACRLILRRVTAGNCLLQILFNPVTRSVSSVLMYYSDGDPRTAAVLLATPKRDEKGGWELDSLSARWQFLCGGELAAAASAGIPFAEGTDGDDTPEEAADWYQIKCVDVDTVKTSETIFTRWMEDHPDYLCA